MRKIFILLLFMSTLQPVNAGALEIITPMAVMKGVPFDLGIDLGPGFSGHLDTTVLINGMKKEIHFIDGKGDIRLTYTEKSKLSVGMGDELSELAINPIPLWLSIIPPLIAILMAMLLREVFTALFAGLFSGVFIIQLFAGKGILRVLLDSILRMADTFLLRALAEPRQVAGGTEVNYDHLSIIVFSMLIGAMVSLITRNGGMLGVVDKLSKYARGPVSGQLVTWLLGVVIFFDDYANTLVVGNTMRPVTDKLRISREKLSYLVDSTAAPIAAIALVTTWIGAELGYIQEGLAHTDIKLGAYEVFLHSLKFAFYPVFSLGFMLMLIFRRVDFGPMLKAERLARAGKPTPGIKDSGGADTFWEEDVVKKSHWLFALLPVLMVVLGAVAGLIATGLQVNAWSVELSFGRNLSAVLGASNAYQALLWSSFGALVAAVVITLLWRLLTIKETVEGILRGFRTMLTAMLILIMAWAIAAITKELHTATFIAESMQMISMNPRLLPALVFVFASLTSFSTGTSWGTMAILYPLMLGSSWHLSITSGLSISEATLVFNGVVASVLAGAVFGDHCSPISDTTILSSLASSCDHVEHVRTQLPYAVTVGLASLMFGIIPASYGLPWYVAFPLGFAGLYACVRLLGRKIIGISG